MVSWARSGHHSQAAPLNASAKSGSTRSICHRRSPARRPARACLVVFWLWLILWRKFMGRHRGLRWDSEQWPKRSNAHRA